MIDENIIEQAKTLSRKQVYDYTIKAFEQKYSWLGKQFAEEALLSLASWNIQNFNNPNYVGKDDFEKGYVRKLPEFRARKHLLLFWQPGFIKSSLLIKLRELIGTDVCGSISDVTPAAIRGSVESGRFKAPVCLKYPYTICSEFGQLVNNSSDSSELIQKLLNILEEGRVSVSLVKVAQLLSSERERATEEYGVKFDDENNFEYQTNWVLMAGTYNKKFLKDNALESRFNIMIPHKRFDADFTRFVCNAPQFEYDDAYKIALRNHLLDDTPMQTRVELPDEVHEAGLTMRDLSNLQSRVICARWWGNDVTDSDIIKYAFSMVDNRQNVWANDEDKIFNSVFMTPKTLEEISKETELPIRQVFITLKRSYGASRIIEDGHDKYVIN
jgi:hypothetical protein